ncbi:MAG: pirin family protein [Chitinophagaceae bacterium]|nr:pirin family protein [Chitinophagaceae bacterium]
MKTKNILSVTKPESPHMVGDGFRVFNLIPGDYSMKEMDPFIMLDYNSKYNFAPSLIPRGVGAHPHKGFETVTIAYKGRVEHHDSSGNGGVIAEGDVQWMSAASGILHKEFHEKEWSKKGGEFQMVQLWVNLPANDKKTAPKYQSLRHQDFFKVSLPNDAGVVEVIAGEFEGHKGIASTFTPIHLYNLKLKKGGKLALNFPSEYSTALLMIEGSAKINYDQVVPEDNFVRFKKDGESVFVEALSDALILVMSGKPIGEPIASYGPFVMNTQQEIREAIDDFNMGRFGYLE